MSENTKMPGADDVLRELALVLGLITEALNYGAFKATGYFQQEDKGKIDRSLAAHLLRFHAKKYLQARGQTVFEEESVPGDNHLDFQNVANSGLFLHCGRYHIRIRKAEDGDIPAPGQSLSRQQFYQQMQQSLPLPENEATDELHVNLLVYWDVVRLYDLSSVRIACPIDGGETRSSVDVKWDRPLPISKFVLPLEPPDAEPDEDLPLELERDDAATGEDE